MGLQNGKVKGMSKRKKIVLAGAALTFLILAACTIISYQTSIRFMPQVKTISFQMEVASNDRMMWFLPEKCILYDTEGNYVVYRIRERTGRFGTEYYAQEIPLEFYLVDGERQVREADGYVRVLAPGLEDQDQLVLESSRLFTAGDTVQWVNQKSTKMKQSLNKGW